VKDAETKKALFKAYSDYISEYMYWMEQQRVFELRHPSFQMMEEQAVQRERLGTGWSEAPVLIVVLGDGRRQWGTVQGAHTFGRHQSHLTDGLANTCMIMHLAAAALGLGTQWNSIHIQEPFKRILDVPDLLDLYLIIPVGFPAVEPKVGIRRDLDEMVHYEKYDQTKFMSSQQVIEYLYKLRGKTIPKYRQSYIGPTEAQPNDSK
jgi:nitroreductase